ncbi:MAG: hypothetical protein OEV66_05415 [Spirochaetia bacterium]|nr:hypothetical protein [Spirochaetia bacterium]
MLSDNMDPGYSGYKIKMIIAIEKENIFAYRNELIVPVVYQDISEAQAHVTKDIDRRLRDSMYFRSQKMGFDLVRYGETATSNTYIAYRILPITSHIIAENK